MKGRIAEAIGVTLLMLFMAVFGCAVVLLSAPHAKADPSSVSVAYAAQYGGAVCDVLDMPAHHTHAGLLGVLDALSDEGLTRDQAAEVVVLSVLDICPRNMPLLKSFIDRYTTAGQIT